MISAYFILAVALFCPCYCFEQSDDVKCKCKLLYGGQNSSLEDCEMFSANVLVCLSACKHRTEIEGASENGTISKSFKCGECEFCVIQNQVSTDETVAQDNLSFSGNQRRYSGCYRLENKQIAGRPQESETAEYVNCTSTKLENCSVIISNFCNFIIAQTRQTSTQITKVATLASPNGSISGPLFLMIGFIIGFAILGVMLVSIFVQARLKPAASSGLHSPIRTRRIEGTVISLKPLAKSGGLLLVPRIDASPVDSVHPTIMTEMPSFDVYKETKNL